MPPVKRRTTQPITHTFADDGRIPNNVLPLVLYRCAIDLTGSPDPEDADRKNLYRQWLGRPVAQRHLSLRALSFDDSRGDGRRARPRRGALRRRQRRTIEVASGDVVVLPAGIGHQRLTQSPDLVVIGAYPPNGKYNLCRGTKAEHADALASIPDVPHPATDPVFGPKGPLIALWRA